MWSCLYIYCLYQYKKPLPILFFCSVARIFDVEVRGSLVFVLVLLVLLLLSFGEKDVDVGIIAVACCCCCCCCGCSLFESGEDKEGGRGVDSVCCCVEGGLHCTSKKEYNE